MIDKYIKWSNSKYKFKVLVSFCSQNFITSRGQLTNFLTCIGEKTQSPIHKIGLYSLKFKKQGQIQIIEFSILIIITYHFIFQKITK